MPTSLSWLAVILAALAALGPFAIDAYLPAFPEMGEGLNATKLEIQQTLTAYMITFAGMALWHGSLSDRYGRRLVIVVTTALFAVASLICAVAPSIEWMWFGRALQGVSGGAGMVVGRALIRDMFDGAQAQRLMARVMMIFSVSPAIAPMVGGALLVVAGWRSIFVFLALFSGVLAWVCWRYLPETLPPAERQTLNPGTLWHAYSEVLTNKAFLLLSGAIALTFAAFFIYVLSAPVFVREHLGLGPGGFGWLFIPSVAGLMGGAWLAGRMAGRWSARRTVAVGYIVMLVGVLGLLLHPLLMTPGVPGSVIPVGIYTFGMSLAMPGLVLFAIDIFPERRGLASSCQSFIQLGLSAVTAGLVVPLIWASPLTLGAGASVYFALGLCAYFVWVRGRSVQATPSEP